jgi:Uma2 family endonuclease
MSDRVRATAAPLHRLSLEDVRSMVAAGVMDEDARVELVEGVLVDLSPIGPEHDGALAWLTRAFVRACGDEHEVRIQSLFLTPDGFLLPDLMVVGLLPRTQQPVTAQLVIEVAHSSRRRDREKALDYARAGVAEYWIVDLDAGAVVVHRDPAGDAYATTTEHRDGTVQPLLGVPVVELDALLGR